MTANKQDKRIDATMTNVLRLQVLDAAGVPMNISAAVNIIWGFASAATAAAALVSKSLGSGIALVSGGVNGEFDVTLSATDSNQTPAIYYHDAIIKFGTVWSKAVYGNLEIAATLSDPV